MGHNNHKIYIEVAISIAKKAGKLLMDNFYSEKKIDYKGRINLVTEIDRRSEKLIVDNLKKEFPQHSILAEEGSRSEQNSEFLWLIDPLDGTTNYAHSFGFFAVSIALQERNRGVIAGVVFAPYLNECYSASRDAGAFLNDNKINVSNTNELEKSLLATGFPYDIKESHANIEYFNRFLLESQAVRRPGSAAIDLCCVAAGKFDGFWEMKLYPWDTAAGSLIVEEAGGKVTDFKGDKYDPYKKEILATNGLIHEDMKRIINREELLGNRE